MPICEHGADSGIKFWCKASSAHTTSGVMGGLTALMGKFRFAKAD
jgi:hypothetical protein